LTPYARCALSRHTPHLGKKIQPHQQALQAHEDDVAGGNCIFAQLNKLTTRVENVQSENNRHKMESSQWIKTFQRFGRMQA
jgi:hypothetical protein